MSWTQEETEELIRLSKDRTLFFSEIARELGKTAGTVRYRARQLGLDMGPPKGRMGCWNRKHAHLHEAVLKFFQTHSWEETREYFGLTGGELKSVFSYAYKKKEFAHLRKDGRRKDPWTIAEILFMLRAAGIQPRGWVSRKLNRGGIHSVKESLSRLNSHSKFINGMPRAWLLSLLGSSLCPPGIKTQAGPTGSPIPGSNFRFVIIPWVQCEELATKYREYFSPELRSAIRAMARFQRWIHQTDSNAVVVRRINQILKEESHEKHGSQGRNAGR